MAKYRITGPDGGTFEVTAPDDATPDQVLAYAQKNMTPKQEAAPAKPIDPMKQHAREEVSAYRKANPTMTMVDDTVRRLARGTPVGSWLDEANAITQSYLPEALGGMPYEKAIAIQRAKDELADEESAVVGRLPVIGDVTAGGLTKLAGGIASAPLAPVARVFQGTTMLPSVGNAAISGAGYGAAYGAGEGETTGERATNAAIGSAFGGTLGAAAPVVASGVANTVAAARNRMAPVAREVAGFDRAAVNRLTPLVEQNRANVALRQRELGGDGMLADMDGAMRDVTEAIAQQPGRQRQVVQTALERRSEGAADRIRGTLDAEMGGPAADLRATEQAIRQHYNQAAAPHYRAFYQSQIPVDNELVAILQAVPDDVWPRVQRMMRMERVDPNHIANTGHGIDLIKRALDDAARGAGRGTNEERLYSNLARDLRNHVDNLLSPGNPADSPWAQGRAIAGEGIEGREALEMGSRVFSGKMDPNTLAADMAGMSQAGREMVTAGARADLRNIMGRAATNFGPNGDATARRALNSEFAEGSLQQVAGPQAAQRIQSRINAENEFADTRNQVLSNSATARRQAGRDIVPRQYDQSQMAGVRNTSLTGIVMEGVGRIANIVTAGALNERNARIATDMARMLVAQGASRDQIISGLMREARKQVMTQQQRQYLRGIVENITRGTAPAAIDAVTAD